jgi:nitrite reductase/ring-hydroxylating ferredoxin subunit
MIVCALHQYGFDLLSGANREGLCNDLWRHEPVYEGNEIGVMIHDND